MPGYGPEPAEARFAGARELFAETVEWLSGQEAAGLTHAEMEEWLGARGRELLRRLHRDHLDLRAARERRQEKVTGADGITRTRAETGHRRRLVTVFGEVRVTRIAYRAAGAANLHPAGAVLNLPEEKHSHGLRRLAAIEAARGSFESAAAAISPNTKPRPRPLPARRMISSLQGSRTRNRTRHAESVLWMMEGQDAAMWLLTIGACPGCVAQHRDEAGHQVEGNAR